MRKLLHTIIIGLLTLLASHPEERTCHILYESATELPITLPSGHEPFHLKNLCNIKPTSALVSKKLDSFVYECMYAKPDHFPINRVQANYTDVVRNFHKR